VGVILSPEEAPERKIEGVGYLAMQDASFADPTWIRSLKELVHALGKLLQEKMKTASDAVLQRAKQEDIRDLYKLPPLRVVVPSGNYLKKKT
jgi:hypothetical protein